MEKHSPEEILDAIRNYYDESVFVTDNNGQVIFVNQLGAKRLGTTIDKLVGKNVKELMDEGMYSQSTVLIALETKQPYTGYINDGGGGKTAAVSHSVPVLDKKGNVTMVVTNNMSKERSKEWEAIMRQELEAKERLKRELDYFRDSSSGQIVANSPAMKAVLNSAGVIADSESNVIILGESGTGKDVYASYIHANSRRSDNAFISVNCAAIPENILEAELFGYEKGVFAGTLSKGKIGLLEAAHGGTIFLDDIGDMPITLQTKLLRVVEAHELRRVGGVENISVDVRVICASNQNLETLVEERKFRKDLYYRLGVFVIKLPPLRERQEDIIPLAESFLQELNLRYGQNKRLSEATKLTMLSHSWPGNIRELRNVVERIFVVSQGNELQFLPEPAAGYGRSIEEMGGEFEVRPLKDYVEDVEAAYINRVIDECGGVVSRAADRLQVHRSVIYRKLERYADRDK